MFVSSMFVVYSVQMLTFLVQIEDIHDRCFDKDIDKYQLFVSCHFLKKLFNVADLFVARGDACIPKLISITLILVIECCLAAVIYFCSFSSHTLIKDYSYNIKFAESAN